MVSSDGTPIAVDFFAGAGGLSRGLKNAGFDVLVANEIHPDPCKTYQSNYPETNVLCEDIREVSSKEIVELAEDSAHEGLDVGDIDLVAGGPPCQGFSTAGEKQRDDPRNNLYKDFVRMVDELEPQSFLMENVTGLVNMYDGEALEEVLGMMDTLDYSYDYEVLNAVDYGVPQKRKRIIFIGYHNSLDITPQHPEAICAPKSRLDGYNKPSPVTIGEAISDLRFLGPGETATEYELPPKTEYQEMMRSNSDELHNHVGTNHSQRVIDRFDAFEQGKGIDSVPEELRTKKSGTKKWHPNGQSRAITTLPNDFVHYSQPRIPTVRETARIQTFPDEHEFKGQRTAGNQGRTEEYCSQTQQVGNAVPPWLAEAVGRQVLIQLGFEDVDPHSVQLIRAEAEPVVEN
jgi:DNA (cytosine-5)-methyltransferase 1